MPEPEYRNTLLVYPVPDCLKYAHIILDGGEPKLVAIWDGEWWLFRSNPLYACWTSVRKIGQAELKELGLGS